MEDQPPKDLVPGATNGGGQYGRLFDPNADLSTNSVDAARVPEAVTPPLTPEDDARIDAALRQRPPRPPLTQQEIAALEAQRGQPITPDQLDRMNKARADGIST